MQRLDLRLSTPEENLALDEALLDEAEAGAAHREVLRLWESPEPFVVLGRNSQLAREVNVPFCRAQGIRVLRRASGGAAVLAGPGSLMYAVVLSYEKRPALHALDQAHAFVLGKLLEAVRPLVPSAKQRGMSDLAIDGQKFSGNSLRCKRRHLVYHGTLLHGADLRLIEACLTMPPRQPDYRRHRPHAEFLTNLPIAPDVLRRALAESWNAKPSAVDWPRQRVRDLVATRYGLDEWTAQR